MADLEKIAGHAEISKKSITKMFLSEDELSSIAGGYSSVQDNERMSGAKNLTELQNESNSPNVKECVNKVDKIYNDNTLSDGDRRKMLGDLANAAGAETKEKAAKEWKQKVLSGLKDKDKKLKQINKILDYFNF